MSYPPRQVPAKRHDHVGHMVFLESSDRVSRQCYCAECGQEWELIETVDGWGRPVCKGWLPLRSD